jgi:hypothetical protein
MLWCWMDMQHLGSSRIHRSRLGSSAGGVGVVVRIFLRRPRPPRDVLIRGYRPWGSQCSTPTNRAAVYPSSSERLSGM